MIIFKCPKCKSRLTLPEESIGKEIQCPTCGRESTVVQPPPATTAAAGQNAGEPKEEKIEFECPSCHAQYRVSASLRGKHMRCGKCKAALVVGAPAAQEARPLVREIAPPAPRQAAPRMPPPPPPPVRPSERAALPLASMPVAPRTRPAAGKPAKKKMTYAEWLAVPFVVYTLAATIFHLPPYTWFIPSSGTYSVKFTALLTFCVVGSPWLIFMGIRKLIRMGTVPPPAVPPMNRYSIPPAPPISSQPPPSSEPPTWPLPPVSANAPPASLRGTLPLEPESITISDETGTLETFCGTAADRTCRPPKPRMIAQERIPLFLVIAAVGLFAFGYGFYQIIHSSGITHQASCTATDIYAGRIPDSEYVGISGCRPVSRFFKETSGSIVSFYFPLTPREQTHSQFALILDVPERLRNEVERREQFVGMLAENALPGNVESYMGQNGFPLSRPYYVLRYKETPGMSRNGGWFVMVVGLFFASMGVFFYWWLRRKCAL